MENKSDLLQKRRAKFDELRKSNINLFPNDFTVSNNIQEIRKRIADSEESLTENDPLFTASHLIHQSRG